MKIIASILLFLIFTEIKASNFTISRLQDSIIVFKGGATVDNEKIALIEDKIEKLKVQMSIKNKEFEHKMMLSKISLIILYILLAILFFIQYTNKINEYRK